MIRYDLLCVGDHAFEAWFSNSEAYDLQRERRLVECPECGSTEVRKQIVAPAVRTSEAAERRRPDPAAMAAKMAGEIRKHISTTHEYVGDRFADEARSMYYGEAEHRPVWGEVSPDVARELAEEGVPAMPLPRPFAPDPPRRREKAN
jgi:hypothetical protein